MLLRSPGSKRHICTYLFGLEKQQHGAGDEGRGDPDDCRDGQIASLAHPRLQRPHNGHISVKCKGDALIENRNPPPHNKGSVQCTLIYFACAAKDQKSENPKIHRKQQHKNVSNLIKPTTFSVVTQRMLNLKYFTTLH